MRVGDTKEEGKTCANIQKVSDRSLLRCTVYLRCTMKSYSFRRKNLVKKEYEYDYEAREAETC